MYPQNRNSICPFRENLSFSPRRLLRGGAAGYGDGRGKRKAAARRQRLCRKARGTSSHELLPQVPRLSTFLFWLKPQSKAYYKGSVFWAGGRFRILWMVASLSKSVPNPFPRIRTLVLIQGFFSKGVGSLPHLGLPGLVLAVLIH